MHFINNKPDAMKFLLNEGISTSNVETYVQNVKSRFYSPNIIEESDRNQTLMSIFDRLASDRVIFLNGEVNETMSAIAQAQLLYMDSMNPNEDILLYIDSGGGCVKSGLTIYDTMNFIDCDVSTICTGMGASMASVLTSSGKKGKRGILKNARIMLHQVSSGMQGNIQDTRITFHESERYNSILFDILSENTGKPKDVILEDTVRDLWLGSQESVDYGLVDHVIINKKDMIKFK